MKIQELIKKYKNLVGTSVFPLVGIATILEDLDQLDEREKPVIPQFVADWIYNAQLVYDFGLCSALEDATIRHYCKESNRVIIWLAYNRNQDTFARAWLDGYTVEEEKRYLVKMKGIRTFNGCLKCNADNANWFFSGPEECAPYRAKHTRKELEEAGFVEVFNSPLFEVEEVEE